MPRRRYRTRFGRPRVVGTAPAPRSTPRPVPPPRVPPPGLRPQAPPFDPIYESSVGQANQGYGLTLGEIGYKELATRQRYGIEDTSDPFSLAAVLKRRYEEGQRRNLNTAGRNLYSSATQRNQDIGTRNYQQDYSGLSRTYFDTMAGYGQARARALLARDAGYLDASADRYQRGLAAREDPGPPAPPARPRLIGSRPQRSGGSDRRRARRRRRR